MKIQILTIGPFKSKPCEELFRNYLSLSRKYWAIEHLSIEVPQKITQSDASIEQFIAVQTEKTEKWLSQKKNTFYLVVLDENGKTFRSEKLAVHFQSIENQGFPEIVFLIGGPYGFHPTFSAKAHLLWSLSPLIFPHELAAVICAEQVLRAGCILHQHPYHHDYKQNGPKKTRNSHYS